MESGGAPETPQVVTDMLDHLAQLAATPWNCAGRDEILGALAGVEQARNVIDSIAGEIAHAARTTGACLSAGTRTAANWAGANTNSPCARVKSASRVAHWLQDFPVFRCAHTAGLLTREHCDKIRSATNRHILFRKLQQPEHQHVLLQAATNLSFVDFTKALQYWINCADPDGTIPDDQQRCAGASVRRGSDGSVSLQADLDPLTGTELFGAIETEKKRFADQAMPETRRNLVALMNLVRRGASRTGDATTSATIHLVMSNTVAEDLIRHTADPDHPVPVDYHDPDRRCELLDGTPIHPKLALGALGIATFRRYISQPKSRDLDVSYDSRSFPTWMKQAMLVLTRGRCAEPGCEAQTHWLHADHIRPHSKAGPTHWDNLQLLCSTANRTKADHWPQPPPPDD